MHTPWTGPRRTPWGGGGDADPAQEAPPREEDPDVGEAGQPTWTPGLPGLSCHVKGVVGFQEFGAGSRDRPGDVGGFFKSPSASCSSPVKGGNDPSASYLTLGFSGS